MTIFQKQYSSILRGRKQKIGELHMPSLKDYIADNRHQNINKFEQKCQINSWILILRLWQEEILQCSHATTGLESARKTTRHKLRQLAREGAMLTWLLCILGAEEGRQILLAERRLFVLLFLWNIKKYMRETHISYWVYCLNPNGNWWKISGSIISGKFRSKVLRER